MVADIDVLGTVEQDLATHPEFSDAVATTVKAVEFYGFAVDLLAERSATVRELAAPLRDATGRLPTAVLEDPLVRVTVDEAMSRLERGILADAAWDEIATMLRLAGAALRGDWATAPLVAEMAERLTVATGPGSRAWLWSAEPTSQRPLVRTFLGMFERDFLRGIPGALLRPTPQHTDELGSGFALLAELFPVLAPSVAAHYVGIGVVDVRTEGETFLAGSVGRIPSVVFFSENRMANPWRLAETALHEGLHLKLFDIQRSASVFAAPERLQEGVKVPVPWLKWSSMVAPNQWALDRALGAFHVYAHLTLFQRAIATRLTPAIRDRFGAPEATDPPSLYRFAAERSRYLGEQILEHGGDQLTGYGREFVHWLLDNARRVAAA